LLTLLLHAHLLGDRPDLGQQDVHLLMQGADGVFQSYYSARIDRRHWGMRDVEGEGALVPMTNDAQAR
jgi:hypothetical protein